MFQAEVLRERLNYFSGQYECHITVCINKSEFAAFKSICESLAAKALTIHLENGDSAIQPMLCKRYAQGAGEVYTDIVYAVSELSKFFKISRVKVEAASTNANIPMTAAECKALPSDCYFEHHLKLELTSGQDLNTLKESVKQYDGYLSKNALSISGSLEERFVTQRFYNCALQQAEEKLLLLTNFLNENDYKIGKVIKEFNIYDSNALLDSGWMEDGNG